MTFRGKSSVPSRALLAVSLVAAVLGVLGTSALPGASAAEKKDRAASGAASAGSALPITREEAENDPDLPGFLEGTIDKGEYLRLRQEQVDERRGLPYQPGQKGPANPRASRRSGRWSSARSGSATR
jgi:hypothetical protein